MLVYLGGELKVHQRDGNSVRRKRNIENKTKINEVGQRQIKEATKLKVNSFGK